MNKIYLLYFVIILFIFYICINKKETYVNYDSDFRLSKAILKYFNTNTFIKNTGNYKILISKYYKNNLVASKYISTTINNFLKHPQNSDYIRYQIKQIFNNNELSKYILKYAYYPTIKYLKLNKNNVKPGFIRISLNNWIYRYHYDCISIIMVQLIGTRTVYTKNNRNDKKYIKNILKPGSLLYIPIGVYHQVEVPSELNVNFTIIVNEKDKNIIKACKKKFSNSYKIQTLHCKYNNCI